MTGCNVFVSYDRKEDRSAACEFEQFCQRSGLQTVADPCDAQLTFVLVGPRTAACPEVDREIAVSLDAHADSPNGLVGVLLQYHGSLPARLAGNVSSPLVLEPQQHSEDTSYALMTTWDNVMPPSSWQFGIVPEEQISEKTRVLRRLAEKAMAASAAIKPHMSGQPIVASSAQTTLKNWWL